MFRRLRERIERALGRLESERTPTRDDIDDLLHGMRDEVIELRARIPRVEAQVKQMEAAARAALRRAEARRGEAAPGPEAGAEARGPDMAAVERALGEAEDFHRQASELRAELARMRQEADEKMEMLKQGRRNRDALLARARRAGTARDLEEALRGPESGTERLERVEEEIQASEDRLEAAREIESELSGRPSLPEAEWELERLEKASAEDEIDRRLEELKREMEEEAD